MGYLQNQIQPIKTSGTQAIRGITCDVSGLNFQYNFEAPSIGIGSESIVQKFDFEILCFL